MNYINKNKINKYRVLLLMPSLKCKGGVTDFCKMIYKNFSPNFCVNYLEVGATEENENLIKKLFNLFRTINKLINSLRNNNFHLVHLNPSFKVFSLLRDSIYLCLITKISYKTRIVVFFHGWDLNLSEKIVKKSIYKKLFVYVYKKVDLIFVLYNKCKEHLIDIGIVPQKIKVTKTFYERACCLKNKNKAEEDKVNILFMSRFVKGKGVEISTEVARLLIESGYRNFKLTLAGDGPLLPLIKEYIKKHNLDNYVYVPGYVEGSDKNELLNKSDIFILPTWLQEGCPISIIEAMGSGLAVISTPMGAIPEIIRNGEDGFICNSQDPNQFFSIIKELLDDKELLRRIQKTAKKKAEENFEIKVFMKKLEEDYLSIVTNPSKKFNILY